MNRFGNFALQRATNDNS